MKGYNRKDFRLSFNKTNTVFRINKKKGVIRCTIEGYLKTPYSWSSPVAIYGEDITATGTARCSKDDVFDEERGKRIALAKAENKAYNLAMSYLATKREHLAFMIDAIDKFDIHSQKQCIHNLGYIESVSNEEHPRYNKKITTVKSGTTYYNS